ncbi:multiple sugar transport system permease protein [Paenibacillus anaericanus]|uniref:Carbohydrate ABC transporter permease n=1 Tax=Paenibacillus anaericanus TaxID=170367 RepID=A0A3S1DMG7_9BACL|nr:carbohydrate ABC transporter permease [Paenibacillus anaericanus]MDQ0091551.1 multiple sugar transport system permease protein [Paenibacillus anaericanus]RUT41355.1 carbohydrate ABC transporter permease [Paenibacillus anaericanus]
MVSTIKNYRILLKHLLIIFFGALMLYPVIWMIMSSLKPSQLIFSDLSLWPSQFTLSNFADGWKGIAGRGFGIYFWNSLIICAFVIVGNVISCSMAAFAFGRLDFSLKRLWFALMLVTIMLPQHVRTIPQYIMFKGMDWLDSFLPLISPKFLATEAFFIFLLVQFIRGLPKELDESARIDGCGPVQIYLRMIMPLALPALVTTALFSFMWTWDDFFSQLLYLNNSAKYTVQLGLRLFMDSTGESAWGPMFAMSVLSLVPSLILFFSMQKYFVEGIATTGIKG